jgi:peptide/nickel transport system substrate-binding protein
LHLPVDATTDPSVETAWLTTLRYDSPLSIGVDGQVQGGVATGWSVSAGGLRIELAIRRDALFSDGTPVTAADVAASIERVWRGAATAIEPWHWQGIDRVEAVADERVRIHLRQADATILPSLASERVPVLPASWVARGWDAEAGPFPPGSGPFQLASVAASELTLTRHPGFYQVGRPRLMGMTIRGAANSLLRANDLVTASVEGLIDVPLLDVPLLRLDPNVTLAGRGGNRLSLLAINLARPAVNDREIRGLIASGIDRPALVRAATASEATPTARLLPGEHWAASEREPVQRSAADVRAALNDRGTFGDLPLRLITTEADTSLANACVFLQEQLAYAGIALTLDLLDDTELARTLQTGDWDLHAMYSSSWRDPHELLRPLLHSRGSLNRGGYASARMDDLLDGATTLTDEALRAQRYLLVQDLVTTDVPVIPLFVPNYYDAVAATIRNYEAFPPVSARGFRQVWMDPPSGDASS